MLAFAAALESRKITVSVRQTRGLDASAACGQLRNDFQKNPLLEPSTDDPQLTPAWHESLHENFMVPLLHDLNKLLPQTIPRWLVRKATILLSACFSMHTMAGVLPSRNRAHHVWRSEHCIAMSTSVSFTYQILPVPSRSLSDSSIVSYLGLHHVNYIFVLVTPCPAKFVEIFWPYCAWFGQGHLRSLVTCYVHVLWGWQNQYNGNDTSLFFWLSDGSFLDLGLINQLNLCGNKSKEKREEYWAVTSSCEVKFSDHVMCLFLLYS